MLDERRVRLLELRNEGRDLLADKVEPGAAGRDLDSRPLRRRLNPYAELVDGLRDPARPKKAQQEARERARQARAHENAPEAPDFLLGFAERGLGVGACHLPEFTEKVPEGPRSCVVALKLGFGLLDSPLLVKLHGPPSRPVVLSVYALNLLKQVRGRRPSNLRVRAR